MENRRGKIFLCIPTANRPKYLNATVESVLEQARRFGHHVEVVVSDTSDKPEMQRQNQKRMQTLQKRYDLPIHYYPPGELADIRRLLTDSTPQEKKAYAYFIPRDGQWGAKRNRLSLLAALHHEQGAQNVFLHLDDDLPLWHLDLDRRVKSGQDSIGLFLRGFHRARKLNKIGFGAIIHGLPASVVSFSSENFERGKKPEKKAGELRRVLQSLDDETKACGPAAITDINGIKVPYAPYGMGEENLHEIHCGSFVRPATKNAADNPHVAHIGWTGQSYYLMETPGLEKYVDGFPAIHEKGWKRLILRAIQQPNKNAGILT